MYFNDIYYCSGLKIRQHRYKSETINKLNWPTSATIANHYQRSSVKPISFQDDSTASASSNRGNKCEETLNFVGIIKYELKDFKTSKNKDKVLFPELRMENILKVSRCVYCKWRCVFLWLLFILTGGLRLGTSTCG